MRNRQVDNRREGDNQLNKMSRASINDDGDNSDRKRLQGRCPVSPDMATLFFCLAALVIVLTLGFRKIMFAGVVLLWIVMVWMKESNA